MLSLAANASSVPDTWKDKPIEKMMTQVGICGLQSHNGIVSNLERQGFSTCRFQEHGSREVIAIDIIGLVEFAVEAGKTRDIKETYFSWLERIVDEIRTDEDVEKLKTLNVEILRSTLRQGSFCYVPAGWIIVEKAVGENHCYSLRTPTMDKTEKSVNRFKDMLAQALVSAPEGDNLMKVWAEYLAALS